MAIDITGMRQNLDMVLNSTVNRLGRFQNSTGKDGELIKQLGELTIAVATMAHLLAPESNIVLPN